MPACTPPCKSFVHLSSVRSSLFICSVPVICSSVPPDQFPACQNEFFCVLRTLSLDISQPSDVIFLFRTVSHGISPSRALIKLGSSPEACGCRSAVFLACFSQDLKQHFLIVAGFKAALNRHFTNQFFFIHVK